jgi:hypothetical protein
MSTELVDIAGIESAETGLLKTLIPASAESLRRIVLPRFGSGR